jgi:transposase
MEKPKRIDITPEELQALLKRAEAALDQGDYEHIKAMAEMITYLSRVVEQKGTSAKRLLQMLFGGSTEKTKQVIEKLKKASDRAEAKSLADAGEGDESPERTGKGHGRNGSSAYTGAGKILIPHEYLKSGDPCPECDKGKVYKVKKPSVVLRVRGQAPLEATVFELEKYRCNLCGAVFTATWPEGVGKEKYDAASGSMIALLKYGSGLPFNRLERLQACLGVPLPASTQWEIVDSVANRIYPAFDELKRQAAQGEIVHNDDTVMKVLSLMKENAQKRKATGKPKKKGGPQRTGMFTSGLVSVLDGKRIALFMTGRKHAGENLEDLLKKRAAGLKPPIQMCDALSRNVPQEFQSLLANCLAHGRRQFVEVAENFPEECIHVLETLRDVYRNDALTRQQKMTPAERLTFHQTESGPLMDKLHEWFTGQLEEKKVEPNSGLGKAMLYMLRHWKKLTLFLREPDAPLDNNICERALKKVIQHRKNSLFFKTAHGAYIGDLFMSLIHTCQLCEANPFDYLTELQKHSEEIVKNPQDWMPWNYPAAHPAGAE